MNRRFPLLSTVAVILTWIGWLFFVLGAISWAVVIGMVVGYGRPASGSTMPFIGLALLPAGIFLVAVGESIRVIFAIEQNTRTSSEALTEMRDAMRTDLQRDKAKPPPKA